jgi:multidrug efflux system outer membrane protein
MKRIPFIILTLTVLVTSCKVGEKYDGLEISLPESYRSMSSDIPPEFLVNIDSLSADSLMNIDWYAMFGDPLLDTLVSRALMNNQDVLIAAENIIQANYTLGIQRSEMLPQTGVEAGATRGNFQGVPLSSPQNLFYGFGFFQWEIDFWGKYRWLNEAARAELLATEAGYRATRIGLVSSVASTYFTLLEYKAQLDISLQTTALRDSMMQIIYKRYDKGIIPQIDVNQAEIQLAIAQASIPVWQRLVTQTENQLSVLIGEVPQEINVGLDIYESHILFELRPELPVNLLSRRPDIYLAEQELIAQNARVGAAQANRLPNISLTGVLGIAGSEIDDLTAPAWNIGGSLLGPLFYFNRFKRIAQVEMSRRDQAQLRYEQTVLRALGEVENILIAIETFKVELIAREAHVKAAINAQRLSQERYNQGVTGYLEYLESQRQAFEAQQNYVSTKQSLLSAYASLYRALGGGWKI